MSGVTVDDRTAVNGRRDRSHGTVITFVPLESIVCRFVRYACIAPAIVMPRIYPFARDPLYNAPRFVPARETTSKSSFVSKSYYHFASIRPTRDPRDRTRFAATFFPAAGTWRTKLTLLTNQVTSTHRCTVVNDIVSSVAPRSFQPAYVIACKYLLRFTIEERSCISVLQ